MLIFGGAGFIGINWARPSAGEHRRPGARVRQPVADGECEHNLEALQKTARQSERLQITVGDIRDAALVERAVQRGQRDLPTCGAGRRDHVGSRSAPRF